MAEQPALDRYLSVRQAAFIGVGAMVGAGIFALLGAAGEVAGAAVWLSFLIAGAIAGLQGYSFAKLGARYPSAGGMLEYVAKGFGDGHFTGITAWLTYSANAIVTAMVAVSFGSYASAMFAGENTVWAKVFAALIIIVMTGVNIVGSKLVAKAQTVIVYVVLGILTIFAVVTLVNMNPSLLAPSGYPPLQRHRLERGADLLRLPGLRHHHLHRQGPGQAGAPAAPGDVPRARDRDRHLRRHRAGRVRHAHRGQGDLLGGTALAVAAEPTLGKAGYWLMSVTALFATAGATNAGLYPAAGLSERLAETRQFPPLMARKLGGRVSAGLLIEAAACLILAVVFKLDAIASIGSAVALLIFTLITAAHFRVRSQTGASAAVLTARDRGRRRGPSDVRVHHPHSRARPRWSRCGVILVLSVGLDFGWKRVRSDRTTQVQVGTRS